MARTDPRVRRKGSPIERFHQWYAVNEGGCWIWIKIVRADGYGSFPFNGRCVLAHRWSYEHFVGPIPDGLTLDHLCRNRACVNPNHLEPVTLRINSLRGEAPPIQRWREDRCIRGHDLAEAYVRTDTGHRMCRACRRERWADKARDPAWRAERATYERERKERAIRIEAGRPA